MVATIAKLLLSSLALIGGCAGARTCALAALAGAVDNGTYPLMPWFRGYPTRRVLPRYEQFGYCFYFDDPERFRESIQLQSEK